MNKKGITTLEPHITEHMEDITVAIKAVRSIASSLAKEFREKQMGHSGDCMDAIIDQMQAAGAFIAIAKLEASNGR